MGSKKHKKESKKKKHRSRSRSPLDNEERERKRHKKHKDRKKDRSPDVEEVPVDSHLLTGKEGNGDSSHSRSRSRERDRRMRDRHTADRERSIEQIERSTSVEAHDGAGAGAGTGAGADEGGGGSGVAHESLSIEETNRLRAKLGLKPLEVNEKTADDGKIKDDLGEFYHVPATNLAHQRKTEKLRQKLDERKEKRIIEKKLGATAALGAPAASPDDEDDAAAWVQRSRDIDRQKKDAAKRAAMLDEMDEVFGVSALVPAAPPPPRYSYSQDSLRGLRVAHRIDELEEERETILTLADKDVLAEDDEDVLVNVNILDDDKYKKNVVERAKAASGYRAYDEEAELEAAALGLRPVLAKYDETIAPRAPADRAGFVIGEEAAAMLSDRYREKVMRERVQGGVAARLESLATPAPRLASDYMDEHDLHANFKKPKRKGKMRKKAKQEPIDVEDYEAGNAPLHTDDTDVVVGAGAGAGAGAGGVLVQDEEEIEVDTELQAALARARRATQRRDFYLPKVEDILSRVKEEVKEEPVEMETDAESEGMVLDATAEFCRSLGDIPTYGLAGNRDHHAQIMDFDRDDLEPESESATSGAGAGAGAEAGGSAWSRVDVSHEQPPALGGGGGAGAGAAAAVIPEPRLGAGVAGALALALSKGYLERAGGGGGGGAAGGAGAGAGRTARHAALLASRYSIEDKAGEEEEGGRRRGGRDRADRAPPALHDFREKPGFRPDVKLEYVDDEGRPLAPKEAFRYLSHKFHGKGPGKNKQEKRIKKAIQEGLMKKMSSTDTPLNTLQMLQDKQRETHSPYILLSGPRRDAPPPPPPAPAHPPPAPAHPH